MTVATHSILPIGFVIENNGRISMKELSDKLHKADSRRFRGGDLSPIIETNIGCLKIEGEDVVYNRKATSYTKHFGLIERSAQNYLHNKIPTMKDWELYEYKTRKNSERCNENVEWKNIPEGKSQIEWFGLQENCDYRVQGNKHCTFSCNVDSNAVTGAIFAFNDDFQDIMELQAASNKRYFGK